MRSLSSAPHTRNAHVDRSRQPSSTEHGLPDIAGLLVLLNDVRKHEAYGDVVRPDELDPENAAREIEDYVESVSRLIR